jgi:hypothetical protein
MVLASCEGIKTVPADMEGEQLECVNEKAKAILWVDWKYGEDLSDYRIVRTAKAHVNVYSDGTFRIISFCKRQKPEGKRLHDSLLLIIPVSSTFASLNLNR